VTDSLLLFRPSGNAGEPQVFASYSSGATGTSFSSSVFVGASGLAAGASAGRVFRDATGAGTDFPGRPLSSIEDVVTGEAGCGFAASGDACPPGAVEATGGRARGVGAAGGVRAATRGARDPGGCAEDCG
jgi:hypothetical protein